MAVGEEGTVEPKLKYPKSVFFIVSNEFCERFAYYGMRTILTMYFTDILRVEENDATVMFHIFSSLAYFFPLIGAIIADSFLGKFRTILYLSIVYAVGQLLLAASSMPTFHMPVMETSIIGLFLIALGTGGIKPCVSAFGGDQFKLPEQEVYLSAFFSLFYFAINSGSLLSTIITPIMRKDLTCFDQNSCYPLAFVVPACLMIVSIVIFASGKRLYKMKQPSGNIVVQVSKCVGHALIRKCKSKQSRDHWLDHADDKYDRRMIEDVKAVIKVLKLFIPLPFFWALFDQQGSRWTFQAARMDGDVFGYVLKPDSFQVLNPIFIIMCIPIFQFAVYPVIEKFLFINTPLRKLSVGGILAGLSFVVSALVEFQLEPTYEIKPSNDFGQLRLYNSLNCTANVTLGQQQFILDNLGMYQNLSVPVSKSAEFDLKAEYPAACHGAAKPFVVTGKVNVLEKEALTYAINSTHVSKAFEDRAMKSDSGDPRVHALVLFEEPVDGPVSIRLESSTKNFLFKLDYRNGTIQMTPVIEVLHNSYKLVIKDQVVDEEFWMKNGGVYTINARIGKYFQEAKGITVVNSNSIHMLWLIPQYIIITMGEIMFSITGLEFAFTQAPVAMKSLLQASWLLTVAVGNLIVVVIAKLRLFDRQSFEFLLFAGLMFVDIMIFAVIARYYTYVENTSHDGSMEEIDMKSKAKDKNETYSVDL
ncbi:peptide transporter family 1 [Trichogramma pretiosum]|uniref:peptide transporter family 1 n=1 Tax=Trichogramma pretiosum TaxID=7493 RepID=UPI0006C9B2B7|nr:peptide transporter family 1 [Trichogramma pretiosum]